MEPAQPSRKSDGTVTRTIWGELAWQLGNSKSGAFTSGAEAYAMIAEPCEPEIDQARLLWRAALGEEFVRLIKSGQAAGAFRHGDPRIAAACVVGAFMEALVGPLTPELFYGKAAQRLVGEIADACLAIVLPARQPTKLGRIA